MTWFTNMEAQGGKNPTFFVFYGRTSRQINFFRFVYMLKLLLLHNDLSADSFICLLAHCFGFWPITTFFAKVWNNLNYYGQ